MKRNKRLRRVDVQVSILVCSAVLLCSLGVFLIGFCMTYSDMTNSLEERAYALYEYVEAYYDKTSFYSLNEKEDMDTQIYQEMHDMLNNTKKAANVRYLYTAKKNEEGQFVYLVDGLDYGVEDFRYPGDLIETEICPDMQKALNGEIVLPKGIKKTDWGKIFITYFPIHDGGQVVGVIGIEFDACHQYDVYTTLISLLPIIILISSTVAILVAFICFRRISNLTYQDLTNTDQLTQLKSRNSYEMDIRNLNATTKKTTFGVVSVDLNHLKLVNDQLGHECGDKYIMTTANILRNAAGKECLIYRMGGDEYIILMENIKEKEILSYIKQVREMLKEESSMISKDIPLSFAIGYALFDPSKDHDLISVVSRADANMYEDKKKYH